MRILLRGIEFEAKHGARAAERRSTRRFQVDVDVTAPVERAASTDRLADTIDYYAICERVVAIGTSGTYRLLETLAARMARSISELDPAAEVTVEVRKLHPPCPGQPAYSAALFTLPARSKR